MELVALFPLEMVLFPGMPLPLHIFEPRYKEMIGELLADHQPFGVVRALENGIAEVGCAAEIVEVVKTYEDGRLDILTHGQSRFRVMRIDQERSFLRGEVQYFDDETSGTDRKNLAELLELHAQAAQLLGSEGELPSADEPDLSFQLAGAMPFDLDFKQTLLAMRSERERVKALQEYYRALLPNLKRAVHARKKAGGNGHVT
ncbi:MAG: LON peptidase substrate-binding domain-containing protein [Candidatus Korobacteraceae bacterium]